MEGLRPVLLVGVGGFVGSVGRFVVGGWVHRLVPFAAFPLGTLVVNVAAQVVLGLAAAWLGYAVVRGWQA